MNAAKSAREIPSQETEQGPGRMAAARLQLLDHLTALRNPQSHWTGELSTSALSTATAVSALSLCLKHSNPSPTSDLESKDASKQLIQAGCEWLHRAQNSDGGFGDTNLSHSNIATTYLVMAAWNLSGNQDRYHSSYQHAVQYVQRWGGWQGLKQRYGRDKTFVIPIMTNCALAGMIDWREFSALPFEAAALPQSWYRFARMPVVSYAVPALVAIGQAHYHFCKPKNPWSRIVRWSTKNRTLKVLRQMQPQSGGFLEAVPLTSFVLMSLAAIGHANLEVAIQCRKFLMESVLSDGSWPIDTNLATWVTSLATRAVLIDAQEPTCERKSSQTAGSLPQAHLVDDATIQWLLTCQHRTRHPFTGAEPGGWGWTDLSGAVPDADDTPAAMLALRAWYERCEGNNQLKQTTQRAVRQGARWLLRLQNRDGGWPTFCRGWGQLPFDRSGNDLTAHAIRGLLAWEDEILSCDSGGQVCAPGKFRRAMQNGVRYLQKNQRGDGSWLPLWFGNQDQPGEENPVYGTGKVLLALAEPALGRFVPDHVIASLANRGKQWLLDAQNPDGGWGGGPSVLYRLDAGSEPDQASVGRNPSKSDEESLSTIEETAVALEGLLSFQVHGECNPPIMQGLKWICNAVEKDWVTQSFPIGFYFAKLWYHERLYPLVFPLAALQLALRLGLELDRKPLDASLAQHQQTRAT